MSLLTSLVTMMSAISTAALSPVLAAALLLGSCPGHAQSTVDDPALEARLQRLAIELRCVVCQNQTLADSHAGLAVDLKREIREQLRSGASDAQIVRYLVERYGDFVLYRPPVKTTTLVLWFGPLVLMIIAGVVLARGIVHGRPGQDTPEGLTEGERRLAAELLADGPGERSP